MKTRILLAALALGAAACSPSTPTAAEQPAEIRARQNGGYFGSGNYHDGDTTRVNDSGYTGSGNLTEPTGDGDGASTGTGS